MSDNQSESKILSLGRRFERVGKADGEFTVCQMNVLARCKALKDDLGFPHVEDSVLEWESRSELLCKVLSEIDADIYCLQEVDDTNFIYRIRGIGCRSVDHVQKHQSSKEMREGAVIAWNRDRFQLVTAPYRLSFAELCDDPSMSQVALVRELEHKSSRKRLMVVTTHLKAKEGNEEVRVRQVSAMLAAVEKLRGELKCDSVVLCGDFNDTPESEALKIVKRQFASAYADLECKDEHFTTFKARAKVVRRCIDYILYTSNTLCVTDRLSMPSADEIDYPHLPNREWPSDHLAIACRFAFRE